MISIIINYFIFSEQKCIMYREKEIKRLGFFFLDAFVQTTDLSSSCGESKLKKEIRRVN